jgi:uncharacterized protein YndB with AHSA1/START domain
MSVSVPDRIEKQVRLRAPLARVWKALTDAQEFGQWFGVRFESPFVAGGAVRGVVTPTTVDAEIAKHQEPYAGKAFAITVERIEPQRLFSFRWNPSGADEDADAAQGLTTLVVFTLEEQAGGVLLTVTESGFDRIPLERRAKAFTANDEGWRMQMTLIEKYLARSI